jgi:hypothetical protein
VDSPTQLQGIVQAELAKRGYALTSLPRIEVSATLNGTRIVVSFDSPPRRTPRSHGGATIDLTLERLARNCPRCVGNGCQACQGRGWKPRHKV